MSNKFKNIFLVCIDHGDDLNYVVARNPSLKKARQAADEARNRWPDKQIYIAVEKMLEEEVQGHVSSQGPYNKGGCACGKGEGDCVSNLSCKCPAIAICKQMKVQLDPFQEAFGSFTSSTSSNPDLESAELNVVSVRRGIVEVSIPDWDPEETIGLSPNEIPRDILQHLEPGVVLEAEVNLEAPNANQIIIENLRLVYEDDDEDDEDEDEDDDEDSYYEGDNFLSLGSSHSYSSAPLASPFSSNPSLPSRQTTNKSDDEEENSLNQE